MIRKLFTLGAVVAVLILTAASPSCGFNQHLVGIALQPGNGTFGRVDPAAFFNYKAYGTYVHPPQTIDITNKVTWQTDNPQVAQVTSAGVVSPNTNCGVAQIFATFHDSPNDIVSNTITITVDGPASSGCPQGGSTQNLSVAVTNAADGTVVSSPTGINCGTVCVAPFASGTVVALTPTPVSGKTFSGWSGCDSTSGTTCSVTLTTDRAVTATFN